MIFNFKKIASVLTSTVMISSTIALAAAANFPAPFVQSGSANVAVVYGQAAANSDIFAVSDITRQLQLELAKQTAPAGAKTGSGLTVSAGADFVKLSKPSDNLNLGNDVYDVFGATLSNDDLPDLLVDGVYSNDENTDYDYEQTISFTNNVLVLNYFKNSDYKDSTPSVGINLTNDQVILNYTLDFTDEPQSDITSSDMVDFETTTIKFLEKEYYISDADNISATGTGTWTLLDTANTAIVKEGETTTVNVGDKSYNVAISFISTTEVKLDVNGEVTNSLAEGGTFKLKDGTYVGIKDILARDVAGTTASVEFSLGSGKLELRGGQGIKMNDDTISEVTTEFGLGSAGTGGRESIDRINLVWRAKDNTFLTPETELAMPGFANLKFSMSKFIGGGEVTKVKDGSSSYLQIETEIKDGAVTIPILYADTSGNFVGIGKDSDNKLFTNNETQGYPYGVNNNTFFNYSRGDRTFVGSWNTSTDAESYYLKFTDFENDNGVNKTTVQKFSNSAWVNACGEDKKAGDTCTIGSLTLTLNSISPHSDRAVNFSGNAGSSFNKLYTKSGLRIALPFAVQNSTDNTANGAITFGGDVGNSSTGRNSTLFTIFFRGEDRNDNLGAGTLVHANLSSNADNEVEVTGQIYTGRALFTNPSDSNHDLSYVYDDVALLFERTGQSSDQRKLKLTYGGGDSYADVILTTKAASVSTGDNATTTTTTATGVKELGSVSVSDSEASSVASRNLIVVGGSCINSVAASLLGGAYCGADFEKATGVGAGSFLIQTFSRTGGTTATLVAGYHAGDTTNAAKYLLNNPVDTAVGKKYKGTTATSAALVTTNSTA